MVDVDFGGTVFVGRIEILILDKRLGNSGGKTWQASVRDSRKWNENRLQVQIEYR